MIASLRRLLVLVLLGCGLAAADGSSQLQPIADVNITSLLDGLLEGYDKRIRPNFGGPPVEVGVSLYILSISSVSELDMDFTIDIYFRQYWDDGRLAYQDFLEKSGASQSSKTKLRSITPGQDFPQKVWVPDTFFVNEKKSFSHQTTTQNEFIRLQANGSVLRSVRLTVTASCPMDLRYFPMDSQLCALELESFGFTSSDIVYSWKNGAKSIGIASDVQLPHFRVLGYRQRGLSFVLTSGNYSRLACEIQFQRSLGFYLIQIYVPCILIVMASWVGFWLCRSESTARVALGITTVLSMVVLMSATNSALPKISYAKAIDAYLGTSFILVFAALLEHATVGYIGKGGRARKPVDGEEEGGEANTTDDAKGKGFAHFQRQFMDRLYGVAPSSIDKYSRIVFPLCFALFNFFYWIIYLNNSGVVADGLIRTDQF